ncbi:MAG: IS630 family transposase [Candidatus Methanoperedenaceae archaeon]|nr:IS630 family transposase [Candidatus Methanoperedenaceae archaeon]
MPFLSQRSKLQLTDKELKNLKSLSTSRTAPLREVERAKILLYSHQGINDSQIAEKMGTNRQKVIRCINKALAYGIEEAIDDLPRSGKPPEITGEARAWIISIACKKPKDVGYPHELWTHKLLAEHIKKNSTAMGFPEASKISSGTISKILGASNIKPHKIASYIHQVDPDFDAKSVVVLHTYKKVELLKKLKSEGGEVDMVIVSYDEKPGIQAIGNKYPDLMPVEGEHPTVSRDYEYIRYGTLSLLAGIDLFTGVIHYKVRDKHRSIEFIEFLKDLDSYYPEKIKIVVILDNLKMHTSKETQKYLETVPQRFQFVFTPKHASWLNIIESFFSKMTRSMLRGIRVSGKNELIERICQYLDEINEMPVIFKWKYRMDEMPGKIESL